MTERTHKTESHTHLRCCHVAYYEVLIVCSCLRFLSLCREWWCLKDFHWPCVDGVVRRLHFSVNYTRDWWSGSLAMDGKFMHAAQECEIFSFINEQHLTQWLKANERRKISIFSTVIIQVKKILRKLKFCQRKFWRKQAIWWNLREKSASSDDEFFSHDFPNVARSTRPNPKATLWIVYNSLILHTYSGENNDEQF